MANMTDRTSVPTDPRPPTLDGGPPPLSPEALAELAAEYSGQPVRAAAIACLLVTSVFIFLRALTRLWVVKTVILADWAIFVAWVFQAGMTAGFIIESNTGLGRHIMTIRPDDATRFGKAYYATNLMYIISLVSIKMSILLLFQRILNTGRVHHACYIVMGFVLFFGTYSLVTAIFLCYPIEKFWDPMNHPGGFCFPVRKAWSDVACHLVGELMILILPMPYIVKLNMPLKQKLVVLALFAMGIFVIIISFIRIPSLVKVEASLDPTFEGVGGAVWSCIEIAVAIICACCMTLRPLASRLLPGFISSSYVQQSGEGDSGRRPHLVTVGSERHPRRQFGADMDDDIPHLPPKPSYSDMSQSTAVRSDTSPSQTRIDNDDVEKDIGLGLGRPMQ